MTIPAATIGVILALGLGLVPHREVAAQAAVAVETVPPAPPRPEPIPIPLLAFSDVQKLRDVEEQIRTNRNWLIATAGAAGLSWIVYNVAVAQCDTINGVEACSRRTDVASITGAVFFSLSLAGGLVSGIMLGVRNGQRKNLERSIQRGLDAGARSPPEAQWTMPPMVSSPPETSPGTSLFDDYRLRMADDRRRFARNGLIGTSAVFGFSWIFIGAAIPRCESLSEGFRCTNAGETHLAIGAGLAAGAATGMVVSAILFAVRSGKKKDLERSVRKRAGSGLHWDPNAGAFVF